MISGTLNRLNFPFLLIFSLLLVGKSFAQVKRENLAQNKFAQADFVLEKIISLNGKDTTFSLNISFQDEGKISTKKIIFLTVPIDKKRSVYIKTISNFKAAFEYQSAEYSKYWENENYFLKANTKGQCILSQPDKSGNGGYITFSKEEVKAIYLWLESLKF